MVKAFTLCVYYCLVALDLPSDFLFFNLTPVLYIFI